MTSGNSDRIQLLEIVGNAVVGGMESYVVQLSRRLPRERFNVVCLCPFESAFTEALRRSGVEVYIAPIGDELHWDTLLMTATLIRIHRIQLMHAHLPNAHLLASLLSSITGVPALATIHGRSVPMRELEICLLGDTHISVVCQSAHLHALTLGLPENRVHFIPNGVDCDYFAHSHAASSLQEMLGIPPAVPLIGFVGRLAPEKGPDVFVRMSALVHYAFPDAHFVLVGDGPMLSELKQMAHQLRLDDCVHFAGVHANMPAVYRSLEVVVSTSYSEGMPLALMEAMAAGRPTVATHVGGVPEIVEVGTTGLLAPPGQPERIATSVGLLLRDPARRHAMGRAAEQRVRANFSIDSSVDKMASLLHRLARSERRAVAVARKLSGVSVPQASESQSPR